MSGTYPATPVPARVVLTSLQPGYIATTVSLSRQARTRGAQRFGVQLDYPPGLVWSDIKELFGFLSAQRGQTDTFDFALPQYYNTGSFAGTPLVDGGSQSGNALNVKGFSLSSADVVARGDFFKIAGDDKVYIITADASSDGSGDATLAIVPQLITSPAGDAAITPHTSGAPLLFKMSASSDLLTMDLGRAQRVGFGVELVEVV